MPGRTGLFCFASTREKVVARPPSSSVLFGPRQCAPSASMDGLHPAATVPQTRKGGSRTTTLFGVFGVLDKKTDTHTHIQCGTARFPPPSSFLLGLGVRSLGQVRHMGSRAVGPAGKDTHARGPA